MSSSLPENAVSKKEAVDQIVRDIYGLVNLKMDAGRRDQIQKFVDETINGDTSSEAHLVISANLRPSTRGVLVYVLTNVRLIKIEIDATSPEMKSSSFPLDTITGVERKVVDAERAEVQVSFQNGSFGLRYTANDTKIVSFFQKVDQSRAKG